MIYKYCFDKKNTNFYYSYYKRLNDSIYAIQRLKILDYYATYQIISCVDFYKKKI